MTDTYLHDYFEREEEAREGIGYPIRIREWSPEGAPFTPPPDFGVEIRDDMTVFPTGATRSAEGDKLDYEGFLSPFVLERYCQYLHKHRIQADGQTRTADNWQKGMPRARYFKSALRHTMAAWKYWRSTTLDPSFVGDKFTDMVCAALFNWMGLLHEILIGRDIKE